MARKKSLVGQVEVDGKTLSCSKWQVWPPKEAYIYDGRTAAEARPEMTIDGHNRLLVWENACGLFKMEAAKCASCPHVLIDGKSPVPVLPNRATASIASRKQMQLKRKKNF